MVQIQNIDNNKCWGGRGATEPSFAASRNPKWHFGRKFDSFLKIYTLLPYDLAIVLLWYFIQMS